MDAIEEEIELDASVDLVWQALTDYKAFGQWFGVKLEAPFQLHQNAHGFITHPGYEHLKFTVHITNILQPTNFAFTWHPYAIDPKKDYSREEPTLVEFDLEQRGSKTLLKLRESGFESIPSERQVEAFKMNQNGWRQQMQNIKNYLTTAQVSATS